jgi:hypothetical protein
MSRSCKRAKHERDGERDDSRAIDWQRYFEAELLRVVETRIDWGEVPLSSLEMMTLTAIVGYVYINASKAILSGITRAMVCLVLTR